MPRIKDRATRSTYPRLVEDAHRDSSSRPGFLSRLRVPTLTAAATVIFVVGAAAGFSLGKSDGVPPDIREDSIAEAPPPREAPAGVAASASNARSNRSPPVHVATTGRPSKPYAPPSADRPTQDTTTPPPRLATPSTDLSSDQIRAVVAQHQGKVHRNCWTSARASSSKASGAVRVSLTLVVSPEGRVVSASSTPDPNGYEGLGGCVVREARAWSFSASSKKTTLSIPFVFAHD